MISELAGFTLSRTVPDNVLLGVMSGAYKVFGGVIRNDSGQIVAHLVDAANPISLATSLFPPLDMAISAVNAVQLSRIGANVSQLVTLAQGTMVLSGLTLAVNAAAFAFLNNKLKSIDLRLEALSKDVKEIKLFLERQERARIAQAFKTMHELDKSVEQGVREKLLISAKQTLGEIHENYRELMLNIDRLDQILAIEEYFTVTALGHALCTAELDMYQQAESSLVESYKVWNSVVERISLDVVLRDEPERFMQPRYLPYLKADELTDWLDFGYQKEKGIDWIDDLRKTTSWLPKIPRKLNLTETLELEVMRKIVQRDRVYRGYVEQYGYFSENSTRPSIVQEYVEKIPESEKIEEAYIFLANDNQA